jgi:drug/metabolite transporter (DMT)-like permease
LPFPIPNIALRGEHAMSMSSTRPSKYRERTGAILVLLSTLAIAAVPILAKIAYEGGSNTLTLLAGRSALSIIATLLLMCLSQIPFVIERRALLTSLSTGVAYGVMLYGYLGAVNFLAVNLVILIYFIHPLLVGLIVIVLGDGKLSPLTVIAPAAALAGLVMAIGYSFSEITQTGVFLSVLAMALAAVVIVGNGRAMRLASALSVIFYMTLSATATLSAGFLFGGYWELPVTPMGWTGFVGAAAAATFGTLAFFVGMESIGTARAAMIANLEPVFGVMFAVMVLGEQLVAFQYFGVALVIGSIFSMEFRTNKEIS